jgi:hypothetical protein
MAGLPCYPATNQRGTMDDASKVEAVKGIIASLFAAQRTLRAVALNTNGQDLATFWATLASSLRRITMVSRRPSGFSWTKEGEAHRGRYEMPIPHGFIDIEDIETFRPKWFRGHEAKGVSVGLPKSQCPANKIRHLVGRPPFWGQCLKGRNNALGCLDI